MTKIIRCKCHHTFQDQRYGPGKRVANSEGKPGVYRCTVCSKSTGALDKLKKRK